MGRKLIFVYGLVAYFTFIGVILYLLGFVGNFAVPKSMDSGSGGSLLSNILINTFLISLFGIQHTIMARLNFKAWFAKHLPEAMERSTFVLFAALLLALLFWQWRPIGGVVWSVENPLLKNILRVIMILGYATVFYSTFIINHFDLFGLRQVYFHWRAKPYEPPPLMVKSLYHYTRNPIMLGFLVFMWATPYMTIGHLVFGITFTVYTLIGINFEEKTLMALLGEPYRQYRGHTFMLVPLPRVNLPQSQKPVAST